ncbi:MAG: hypothetical protein IPJ32_08145 [Sphingobacteriaceae bacterium]|nr:hypothetical protein [Sphingobacteriaceae bacterium]
MSKFKLLFIFLHLLPVFSFSQILNEDAKGESSIVTSGGALGINIETEKIRLNYYKMPIASKGFAYGIDFQGKNTTGIVNLFKKSKFQADANLSCLLGYKSAKTVFTRSGDSKNYYSALEKQNFYNEYASELLDTLDAQILRSVKLKLKDVNVSNELKDTLNWSANFSDFPELTVNISKRMKANAADSSKFALLYSYLLQLPTSLDTNGTKADYDKALKRVEYYKMRADKFKVNSTAGTMILGYARAGGNVKEFTLDKFKDSAKYDQRFIDTNNVSAFFEIGITYVRGMHYFGCSVGFNHTDNFSSLDDKSYKYVTTDTSLKSGVLTSTKEFTGYSGNYGRLNKPYIYIDYLYLIHLEQEKYLGLNGYMRNNFSTDYSYDRDMSSLGFGTNFINGKSGKLMGGFFVQTNDLFASKEPRFLKTISFGLQAKFSLTTIFVK